LTEMEGGSFILEKRGGERANVSMNRYSQR
jgi:hypothetical protein